MCVRVCDNCFTKNTHRKKFPFGRSVVYLANSMPNVVYKRGIISKSMLDAFLTNTSIREILKATLC